MPCFRIESQHQGVIAGVDEVGRGPLAGPVLAAAVVFHVRRMPRGLGGINDSKALDAATREKLFLKLTACPQVSIGVGAASVGEIARLNILRAAHLAMVRAVSRLPCRPDLVLVDGNMAPDFGCPARTVIGGDALCFSIAAASIVAKVLRDRIMARLDPRRPGYGWGTNAGYATAQHRAALQRLGPTPHHRPGFAPVDAVLAARLAASLAPTLAAPAPQQPIPTGQPAPQLA